LFWPDDVAGADSGYDVALRQLAFGANPNETILTPQNVNKTQFGKLFTQPWMAGDWQALYLPQVTIRNWCP